METKKLCFVIPLLQNVAFRVRFLKSYSFETLLENSARTSSWQSNVRTDESKIRPKNFFFFQDRKKDKKDENAKRPNDQINLFFSKLFQNRPNKADSAFLKAKWQNCFKGRARNWCKRLFHLRTEI
jgi:hypothetical protein